MAPIVQHLFCVSKLLLFDQNNACCKNRLMALGKRLKQARDRRGLNQSELAAAVNQLLGKDDKKSTQQNIAALEERDSNKTEHAYFIALALDVSLVWLLTGRGSMEQVSEATVADLLPGLNVSNLAKIPSEKRAFLAGRLDREIEKWLTEPAEGPESGKETLDRQSSAPLLASR